MTTGKPPELDEEPNILVVEYHCGWKIEFELPAGNWTMLHNARWMDHFISVADRAHDSLCSDEVCAMTLETEDEFGGQRMELPDA